MPNVGPMDGCRMATIAFLPSWPNACPRPIVVVVLPSPSGVGVMAETTTYLPIGRSASSSTAAREILLTECPYGSSRCSPSPMDAATSGIGSNSAAREMSRSVGMLTRSSDRPGPPSDGWP